mmetsp:Transcript_14869/g.30016  ORF Transcript_14869/g.30016 Transcript_14869/m.30016 type:complete len:108 (-) Transcript_14869:448-771(-)
MPNEKLNTHVQSFTPPHHTHPQTPTPLHTNRMRLLAHYKMTMDGYRQQAVVEVRLGADGRRRGIHATHRGMQQKRNQGPTRKEKRKGLHVGRVNGVFGTSLSPRRFV